MKKSSKEVLEVDIADILPDEQQPRKNFNPERMADLMRSIQEHGIINPLVVEKYPSGKYLLVDGERRYRAAKELKLKEVPVLITKPQKPIDRLVHQFHIQEQHEGWSPVEKATAVLKLSQELKVTIPEMGRLLALPSRTVGNYMAFAELMERKEFEKSETPLTYAGAIVAVRKYIRSQFEKIDDEFTPKDEAALERSIISRIKKGEIAKRGDITKIRDAARTNPQQIKKFLRASDMTIDRLFLDSKARVAFHYRNIVWSANRLSAHIKNGMDLKVANLMTTPDWNLLRNAAKSVDALLGKE
jgi:ParB family chromosome partitioning protein